MTDDAASPCKERRMFDRGRTHIRLTLLTPRKHDLDYAGFLKFHDAPIRYPGDDDPKV